MLKNIDFDRIRKINWTKIKNGFILFLLLLLGNFIGQMVWNFMLNLLK